MVKISNDKMRNLSVELQLASITNLMAIIQREIEKDTAPTIICRAVALFIFTLISNLLTNVPPEIHEHIVNNLLHDIKYMHSTKENFVKIPIETASSQ